ncbi:HK97 gp10 family phage protein [Lactobacillus sp. XV13L]|nr:HK97 gp10 family phage protein [Lactobacillus sp. XV13L]
MTAFGDFDDKELQEFADHVHETIAGGVLKQELTKSTKQLGQQYKRNAQELTPVATGDLRRSWQLKGPFFSGSNISIELRNNKEYASFVEYGHRQTPGRYVPAIGKRLKASWVPGQHFLEKATSATSNQVPELLTPVIWDIMRRLMNE